MPFHAAINDEIFCLRASVPKALLSMLLLRGCGVLIRNPISFEGSAGSCAADGVHGARNRFILQTKKKPKRA